MRVLRRSAARVALVEPTEAVLLLSGRDPSLPEAPRFWFLPGGGLDPGETPEQALKRELYEELGARVGDLGPPVWRRRAEFVFDGQRWEQDELVYVARTERFTPAARGFTELERRMVTGARWWPLDLLAASAETVYPGELASLLAHWLVAGPPPSPLPIF